MTRRLYLDDAYRRTGEASVVDVRHEGRKTTIVLDQTILQPSHRDGGDRGTLRVDGREFYVPLVAQSHHHDRLEHRVKGIVDVAVGSPVAIEVDWTHRYELMRRHTANHLLYGAAKTLRGEGFPAVSKTSVTETYTHWVGLASEVDEAFVREVFALAATLVAEERPVTAQELPREEAIARTGAFHGDVLPPNVASVRVVAIEDFDADPCIGLHVANLREVGDIRLVDVQRHGDDLRVLSTLAPTPA